MAKTQVLGLCACLVFVFSAESRASTPEPRSVSCRSHANVGAEARTSRPAGPFVYRDRPLAEVVADVSRLGPRQILSGPRASKIRFSGVLVGNDQAGITRKITLLTPVFARCENGAVVLHLAP